MVVEKGAFLLLCDNCEGPLNPETQTLEQNISCPEWYQTSGGGGAQPAQPAELAGGAARETGLGEPMTVEGVGSSGWGTQGERGGGVGADDSDGMGFLGGADDFSDQDLPEYMGPQVLLSPHPKTRDPSTLNTQD